MEESEKKFDVNELIKDREITNKIYIEGVGTVTEYGKLNMDKMIDMLLKSPYIIE